jgi:hypothetical protein
MKTNLTATLEALNARIEEYAPYAKRCRDHGIEINADGHRPMFQGWVDRAREFCELVRQRAAIEAAE